jgi:predicted metal-dependent hydrolase
MFIQLGDYEIEVLIERKNNKNIYFRFKEDGKLHVTANRFVSESAIKKMIIDNEKSLLKMYVQSEKRNEINNHFYYLGDPYTKVLEDSVKKVYMEDEYIYAKNDKMLDKWYKDECLKIFTERANRCLEMFNDIPSFQLKVRTMKTRWGSLSKKTDLQPAKVALNTLLICSSNNCIKQVIYHELCHLIHPNHGKGFYEIFGFFVPDWKTLKKELEYLFVIKD